MEAVTISAMYLDADKDVGDHVYLVKYPEMTEGLYLLETYDIKTDTFTAIEQIIH